MLGHDVVKELLNYAMNRIFLGKRLAQTERIDKITIKLSLRILFGK